MRCIQIVYGRSVKKAIQNFQMELICGHGDYITQLIDIEEVPEDTVFVDHKSPNWTLEDGTKLDENDQELLNYAFENYVNEDGLTMKEVIDNKNK
jgi:hypothetical protein